jgi:membrane protein DedA with SNARE-associated domain
MMHDLIVFWFDLVANWGYLGVIVLMAMESSIFPVPSEVVIPPAAYWAAQGKMSFWGVVLAGTFGSWLGSAITYWISLWVGRLVVVRWGRYFFISEEKLGRAERFVHRYEAGGIFFARLLPVVRHLISIPAGIIRMNFGVFSAMTTIGAFIWCYVLAWMGREAAVKHPDLIKNPEQMVHAMKAEALPIVGVVIVLCALYVLMMKLTGPAAPVAPLVPPDQRG